MAASIGAQSFISLETPLRKRSYSLVDISDNWEDGTAIQRLARRAGATTHVATVDVPSLAIARGLIDSYAAMVGTSVTVVQFGGSFANVFVWSAEVVSIQEGITAVGGLNNGTVLVTSQWMLQYIGLS